MRHIYALIVDVPEREPDIAHALGHLADNLITDNESGTLAVYLDTIVPHEDGFGLRPRVILEEVRRGTTDPG